MSSSIHHRSSIILKKLFHRSKELNARYHQSQTFSTTTTTTTTTTTRIPSSKSQLSYYNHLPLTTSPCNNNHHFILKNRNNQKKFITQIHSIKKIYKNLLFVCKANDERVKKTLETLISYLAKQRPEVCPILEEDLCEEEEEEEQDDGSQKKEFLNSSKGRTRRNQIDLVIALGGDGTVLHVSHIFKNTPCPPILGFNFGTIGFLLHFAPIDKFKVIDQVLDGHLQVEHRMRLNCFVGNHQPVGDNQDKQEMNEMQPSVAGSDDQNDSECGSRPSSLVDLSAINEVSLHRTGCPHMVAVNIHIEGRFLTQAVADGLIVATPTGSTAYSCSAGGSIVYPTMQAILLTPICPRSLSFRPLILPPNLSVQLTLDPNSRSTAELRVDGISIKSIQPGESVEIRAFQHAIQLFSPPCFNTNNPIHQDNHNEMTAFHDYWIDDLNMMLNFNRSYQPKDFQPPIK